MIVLMCWPDFADTVLASLFPADMAVFGKTGLGLALQIATFHTLFNIINTLLFLPFIKGFVWLAEHLVPSRKEEKTPRENVIFGPLDERIMRSPSVALGYLYQQSGKMFSYAMDTLDFSFHAFLSKDVASADKVAEHNRELAEANKLAVSYLVKISTASLVTEDENTVSKMHYVLNDIMRIGELADNVAKYTHHYVEDELIFSDEFLEMIGAMYEKIKRLYVLSLAAFLYRDGERLSEVDVLEDEIDRDRRDLVERHIKRLNEGKCQPQNSGVFINLVGNLERAADHITYIAHSID